MNDSSLYLAAEDLSLVFGSHVVLEHFSHRFERGTLTHILGSNGTGKSTLIKALCGLKVPTAGNVNCGCRPLLHYSSRERARLISYIPQRLEAVPPLGVRSFIAQGTYAAAPTFSLREEAFAAADRAIDLLQIGHLRHRCLSEISGGELQICVLASAIAQETSFIFLDEPTSGLDLNSRSRLNHALSYLVSQGTAIIESTHDLAAVRNGGDCIVLGNHRCLWSGASFPPESILHEAFAYPASENMPACSIKKDVSETQAPNLLANQALLHHHRLPVIFICLSGACLLALFICPFIGSASVTPDSEIFRMLRIPRVIWGAVSGAVLALAGAGFQSLFQNTLATPYTLGTASGASFGALLGILLGASALWGVPLMACIGGLLTMGAVLGIASRFALRHAFYCLMAGIAAAMFFSAAGLTLQSLASPLTAHQMMRWQMGGLDVVGYSEMLTLPLIGAACAVQLKYAPALDMLSVDESLAAARGVDVKRVQTSVILASGTAVSLVVAMCGPISFVGLIVPNALRRIVGPELCRLMPASMLTGALFIMLADTLSRLLEAAAWIPVGVIAAVIGTPLFIIALWRSASHA